LVVFFSYSLPGTHGNFATKAFFPGAPPRLHAWLPLL
jgi:hypothetical protein